MNAGLEEVISGIEVVKANAQEEQEQAKFATNAERIRDLAIKQGYIQARYLPFLVYGVAFGVALLHALFVYLRHDGFGVGQIVAYIGLVCFAELPHVHVPLDLFATVQMGLSSAERILTVLNTETELDENESGVARPIQGEVVFEDVTFGYTPDAPVLKHISFHAATGRDDRHRRADRLRQEHPHPADQPGLRR